MPEKPIAPKTSPIKIHDMIYTFVKTLAKDARRTKLAVDFKVKGF